MLVQIGLECKGFVASYADKRFCVGVGLNMSTEIGFVSEGLVANVASKWLLT